MVDSLSQGIPFDTVDSFSKGMLLAQLLAFSCRFHESKTILPLEKKPSHLIDELSIMVYGLYNIFLLAKI